jgi:hypothetical protein
MNTDPMKLRVVRVDPGQDPVDTTIPNNLQGLQGVVGGNLEKIETIPMRPRNLGRSLIYYSNEAGLRLGLPPNRNIAGRPVVGTILAVGAYGSQEVDLTDDEVADAVRGFAIWPKIG